MKKRWEKALRVLSEITAERWERIGRQSEERELVEIWQRDGGELGKCGENVERLQRAETLSLREQLRYHKSQFSHLLSYRNGTVVILPRTHL